MSHVRGPYGNRTRTTRRDKPALLPFNQRTNFDFPDYRELYWSCVKLITKKNFIKWLITPLSTSLITNKIHEYLLCNCRTHQYFKEQPLAI